MGDRTRRTVITRRTLMRAAMTAFRPAPGAQATEVTVSACPGAPFRAEEFATVGVFGLDWLLDGQFTRLLDNIAASPGAVRGVRAFGSLSGGRDKTFPKTSTSVWDTADQAPDFTRTFSALETLVSRNLTPFLPLTFFPPAVSPIANSPPPNLQRWQHLVKAFLTGAAARFGAGEMARWWFEVWNEPNMPPFWDSSFDRYLELYRATSDTVLATGLRIRLGGPVVAYMPDEGAALIERFLTFLHDEPQV